MQIRRVLVPIDGSELSLRAVDAGAELARRFDAGLTLLTAVDPPEAVSAYLNEAALEAVRQGVWQVTEAMLDQAAARVGAGSEAVEKRIVWGAPATAIAEAARSGYDIIVMGSRGLGMAPSDRHFLGSVTERVLRRAGCPVLVIPEAEEE